MEQLLAYLTQMGMHPAAAMQTAARLLSPSMSAAQTQQNVNARMYGDPAQTQADLTARRGMAGDTSPYGSAAKSQADLRERTAYLNYANGASQNVPQGRR